MRRKVAGKRGFLMYDWFAYRRYIPDVLRGPSGGARRAGDARRSGQGVDAVCTRSLERMGLDYFDLYLARGSAGAEADEHTSTQAPKHTNTQTHKQTNKQSCVHLCIDAYMHMYMPVCMHAHMHTCMHAYTHRFDAYMHTSIRAYTHARMHTCMHTCIHT